MSSLLATIICHTRAVMRMCKERMHGPISRYGRQAWLKMQYLWCLWPVQNDSKYTEASFLPISLYSFAILVAQAPRSPKQVIFVRTTTTTDIQTDCFIPCACALGKILQLVSDIHCNLRGWAWLTVHWRINIDSRLSKLLLIWVLTFWSWPKGFG